MYHCIGIILEAFGRLKGRVVGVEGCECHQMLNRKPSERSVYEWRFSCAKASQRHNLTDVVFRLKGVETKNLSAPLTNVIRLPLYDRPTFTDSWWSSDKRIKPVNFIEGFLFRLDGKFSLQSKWRLHSSSLSVRVKVGLRVHYTINVVSYEIPKMCILLTHTHTHTPT